MAHQVHNIPWTLLASHFRLVQGTCRCSATDLHPRKKPTQAKELTYFAEAFARNVAEHSVCERRKYSDTYEPSAPNDVILDEKTTRKIQRSVQRSQDDIRSTRNDNKCRRCWFRCHCTNWNCRCSALPLEERTMAAFLGHCNKSIYGYELQRSHNFEVVKLLLLYGEMEPLLRVCAHPDVDLKRRWSRADWWDNNDEIGWGQLCKVALLPYTCLNLLHCFPETWDDASGRTNAIDYRCTGIYQYMLWACTTTESNSDVGKYPHRQFFGIADDQFSEQSKYAINIWPYRNWRTFWLRSVGMILPGFLDKYPYGMVPLEEMLSMERPLKYQPDRADVPVVRRMLCCKGLPVELAMEVMRFASYEPRRRLKEPHDPFHRVNRDEMARYLRYCWQVLVRCDMMARELGMKIPWRSLVTECVGRLLGSEYCNSGNQWQKLQYSGDYSDMHHVFI